MPTKCPQCETNYLKAGQVICDMCANIKKAKPKSISNNITRKRISTSKTIKNVNPLTTAEKRILSMCSLEFKHMPYDQTAYENLHRILFDRLSIIGKNVFVKTINKTSCLGYEGNDIAQEALGRICENISNYNGNSGIFFYSWAISITKNVAYSLVRKALAEINPEMQTKFIKKGNDKEILDFLACDVIDDDYVNTKFQEYDLNKEKMLEIIRNNKVNNTIVKMHLLDKLNFVEIAATLNMEYEAVKKSFQRYMKKLKECVPKL